MATFTVIGRRISSRREARFCLNASPRPNVAPTVNASPDIATDNWRHKEISAVGATGAVAFINGKFTVTGRGADIWNTADEFRYVTSRERRSKSDDERRARRSARCRAS